MQVPNFSRESALDSENLNMVKFHLVQHTLLHSQEISFTKEFKDP